MKDKSAMIQKLEEYRLQNMDHRGTLLPDLTERFVMAWIFHDNLLEGRSLNPEEIQSALRRNDHLYPSYVRPVLEDIRLYERAIDMIWQWSYQGHEYLTLNRLKSLHKHLLQFEPKEGARVRTNSPVHRDYHQEICTHTAVPKLLQELFRFIQNFHVDTQEVIMFAAELHHRLMYIYPYRRQPGALARLFTNQFMLSHGYPPIILASHERGAYYDALSHHDHSVLGQLFYKVMWRFLEVSPTMITDPEVAQANIIAS